MVHIVRQSSHDINVEEQNVEWDELGHFWWALIIECQWAHLRFEGWRPNIENRGTLNQMSKYAHLIIEEWHEKQRYIEWVLILMCQWAILKYVTHYFGKRPTLS